ncbi:hypothetical protein T484DRAFT_1852978 [Baffinella frigidus]|nr:hypothetical protein T484DRAFT_1852978 [Cryptophyta sp. CCMP2293]
MQCISDGFKRAVAVAAGVDETWVEITAIREVAARRRTAGVEVDFRVAAESASAAEALSTTLGASSLNSALAAKGLPAATVLLSAAVVTVLAPGDAETPGGDEGGVGVVAGAAGGGAALLLVGVVLWMAWRRRRF